MSTAIPSLAQIRVYVAHRLETDSPGAIARAIGIPPGSLAAFVAGRSPYARTRDRLLAWWFAECPLIPPVSTPGVQQAIADVLDDLPPGARPGALQSLTRMLRHLHAQHPDRCPTWVAELAGAAAEPASATPGCAHGRR